jgi:phage terminase small subunit
MQLADAMRRFQSLLAEFGLTPAAIQKVGGGKQKPQENPFGRFGTDG